MTVDDPPSLQGVIIGDGPSRIAITDSPTQGYPEPWLLRYADAPETSDVFLIMA